MYIVATKITRPNVNCAFYTMVDELVSPEVKSYWVENYKSTGKCIYIDLTMSENFLELGTEQYWESKEIYEEYKNDVFLKTNLFDIRDSYWLQHGCTVQIISERELEV